MRTKIICTAALTLMLFVGIFAPMVGTAEPPEGWSEDIRLTYPPTHGYKANIDVYGSSLHITYEGWSGDTTDVYHISSTDSGRSWSSPVQISDSGVMASWPDVGFSDNNVHIVWGDWKTPAWEIFYRRSEDGGDTWFPERMISSNDGYNSQGPKIAVSDDGMSIHVVWVDARHKDDSFPQNTELYYNRSLDGGLTWEGEVRLTYAPRGSSNHRLALYGESLHLTWYDDRSGSFDVYYMRSTDNGATWGEEVLLATSSDDQGPQAISAYDSNVHVIWVEEVWPGPNYYLYYRRSTDNGVTWGAAEQLSGPSPVISNPDISVLGDEVNIVWADRIDDGENAEIYFKESIDGGITWNDDLRLTDAANDSWRPSIVLVDNMKHVVWHDMRDGNNEIYYKRNPDFNDEPIPEFANIAVPVVATLLFVTVATRVWRKEKYS